jgi:hypothetical protein
MLRAALLMASLALASPPLAGAKNPTLRQQMLLVLGFGANEIPTAAQLADRYSTQMTIEARRDRMDESRINDLIDAFHYLGSGNSEREVVRQATGLAPTPVDLKGEPLAFYRQLEQIFAAPHPGESPAETLFRTVHEGLRLRVSLSSDQHRGILVEFAVNQMQGQSFWNDEFKTLFASGGPILDPIASEILLRAKVSYMSKIFFWNDASTVASNLAVELKLEQRFSFEGLLLDPQLYLEEYLKGLRIQGFPSTPKEFLVHLGRKDPAEFQSLVALMSRQVPQKVEGVLLRERGTRDGRLSPEGAKVLREIQALDGALAELHSELQQAIQFLTLQPLLKAFHSLMVFKLQIRAEGMVINEMKRNGLPTAQAIAAYFARYRKWSFMRVTLPITRQLELFVSGSCNFKLRQQPSEGPALQ